MKQKIKQSRKSSTEVRRLFEFFYNQKFYNKWMNKFKFDGLNYQQIDYIMKKFWGEGTISCSKPDGIPNNLGIDMKEDSIIFTPYAPQNVFNIYDYPTQAIRINTRGVSFISARPLDIDKEIVIGYCQKNKKSIYSSIECKLKELVDLEMTIRTNIKTQKSPYVAVTTPENKSAVEDLMDGLENDDPILFTTLEESEKAKALVSGVPYTIDKLEQMRQKIEDDILTILGCQNVGIAEKKEHLLVDEVNANNQNISESSDDFLDMVSEFFDRVDKVLGYKVTVSLKHEEEEQIEEDDPIDYNKNEEGKA